MYQFTVQYSAGKWHRAPDSMSRYPTSSAMFDDHFTDIDFAMTVAAISSMTTDTSSITWEELHDACKNDEEYRLLAEAIQKGFSDRKTDLPPSVAKYWDVKDYMTTVDGICLFNTRPVIPQSLRARVLSGLHSAHQGMAGMRARANMSVYWPGLNKSLRNYLDTCAYCRIHAPSQPKEPYCTSPNAEWPYDQIVGDYFDYKGKKYLVIADRFSGNLHIYHCGKNQATAQNLISVCRNLFTLYGVPREFASDGGSVFMANEFQTFLRKWGTAHRLSSAYYPQSNGRAELAVKAARRIIAECTHPSGSLDTDAASRALLQFRNTPISTVNKAPSQLLYGRLLRDHIPTHKDMHQPHPEWILSADDRHRKTDKRNQAIAKRYNSSARPLRPLQPGTRVSVQNQGSTHPRLWEHTGTIEESLPHRQYRVRIDGTNAVTLRNRRFLRPLRGPAARVSSLGGGEMWYSLLRAPLMTSRRTSWNE